MRIDDTPSSWDERTTLTTMLDYARDTVRAKCEGPPRPMRAPRRYRGRR